MACCSVNGCTSRSSKKVPGITFHRFPTDEAQLSDWIKATRRKNWRPTQYSKMCSKHFTDEMLDRTLPRVRLMPDAIPMVFKDSPEYLKKKKQGRKKPSIIINSVPRDIDDEKFTSRGVDNDVKSASCDDESSTSAGDYDNKFLSRPTSLYSSDMSLINKLLSWNGNESETIKSENGETMPMLICPSSATETSIKSENRPILQLQPLAPFTLFMSKGTQTEAISESENGDEMQRLKHKIQLLQRTVRRKEQKIQELMIRYSI